jgi:hypothetical protein
MRVTGDLDFMRAHEKSAVKARSHVGIGSLANLDSAILQTQHSFFFARRMAMTLRTSELACSFTVCSP